MRLIQSGSRNISLYYSYISGHQTHLAHQLLSLLCQKVFESISNTFTIKVFAVFILESELLESNDSFTKFRWDI